MAQKWHVFGGALPVRHTLKKADMATLAPVPVTYLSHQRIAAYMRTKGWDEAEARPDRGAVVARGVSMPVFIKV